MGKILSLLFFILTSAINIYLLGIKQTLLAIWGISFIILMKYFFVDKFTNLIIGNLENIKSKDKSSTIKPFGRKLPF